MWWNLVWKTFLLLKNGKLIWRQKGLDAQNEKLAQDYCVCMWDQPLSKLSDEQIRNFGKISPEEQLKLLGGAEAFDARDKQCVADLKAE